MVLDKGTIAKIREYHKYHGDANIKIVKTVEDNKAFAMVLVRVGDDVSCLDDIDFDGYVSEFDSCKRCDEAEMIRKFKEDDYEGD